MKNLISLTSLLIILLASISPRSFGQQTSSEKPVIQLAILLDTSNSMDGLIDQARAQLWKIVNQFIGARSGGAAPELQVALYEYGNTRLKAVDGYIRQVLPLTTDLDAVSEKLFALKTNGGDEYCGQVIGQAVKELAWSPAPGALRMIFIAGNEPFTQGPVDFHDSCKAAASRGITVSTIHCGPSTVGIDTHWKDGAVLADGSFLCIDQNQAVAHVEAPQDAEIARLGAELNATYLPYGAQGALYASNQAIQDSNAMNIGNGTMVQRALTKSSAAIYTNDKWDLVDALNQDKIALDKLDEKDLPESMKKLSIEERRKLVEEKTNERERLQTRIKELGEVRDKYVSEEMKKRAAAADPATSATATLDTAVIDAIRKQAATRNIELKAK